MLMRLARLSVCTVREQRIKLELLVTSRLTGKFSKMPELGADIGDTMFCECGDKFVLAKLGKWRSRALRSRLRRGESERGRACA